MLKTKRFDFSCKLQPERFSNDTNMKPGDKAYIIETNNNIREVEVIKESGGFVTVRYEYTDPHYISGGKHHIKAKGGMRLRRNRVYRTKEEAEKAIKEKKEYDETIRIIDSFI